MTLDLLLRPESHETHTAFTNYREWVAATDEITRETEMLARSADAFNGTGAYVALAYERATVGSSTEP
jgi:hypothetical protein